MPTTIVGLRADDMMDSVSHRVVAVDGKTNPKTVLITEGW